MESVYNVIQYNTRTGGHIQTQKATQWGTFVTFLFIHVLIILWEKLFSSHTLGFSMKHLISIGEF